MNDEATQREVEERLGVVKGLYGDRMDDGQLEEARKAVESIVAASQALRAVKLDNRHEPFTVFTPYREGG